MVAGDYKKLASELLCASEVTEGGCWIYPRVNSYGVAEIKRRGKRLVARGVLMQLQNPADGVRKASNRCGNDACVNPEHIVATAWRPRAALPANVDVSAMVEHLGRGPWAQMIALSDRIGSGQYSMKWSRR